DVQDTLRQPHEHRLRRLPDDPSGRLCTLPEGGQGRHRPDDVVLRADAHGPAHVHRMADPDEIGRMAPALTGTDPLRQCAASGTPRSASPAWWIAALMPMLAMAACGGETAPPAQEAGTAAPTEDAPAPTAMPEGARACRIEGWVIDRDPAGLNVRAAPARDAGVLGTLPPYVENGDGRGFGIPVHVQASLDGWFLIEAGDDDPDRTGGARRPVYSGQGWVAANMVRFSLQSGRGYARPDS